MCEILALEDVEEELKDFYLNSSVGHFLETLAKQKRNMEQVLKLLLGDDYEECIESTMADSEIDPIALEAYNGWLTYTWIIDGIRNKALYDSSRDFYSTEIYLDNFPYVLDEYIEKARDDMEQVFSYLEHNFNVDVEVIDHEYSEYDVTFFVRRYEWEPLIEFELPDGIEPKDLIRCKC